MKSTICALVLVVMCGYAFAGPGDSQVTVGSARFTVITPNLIRIEFADNGKFTDERTLFAANRSVRFDGAHITQDGKNISIDTGSIVLTYRQDGKPLSAANLSATIRVGDKRNRWTPGADDPLNLGGTLTTLDRIRGAVDLGQGLISRSGWALVDDSGMPVLTKDWAASRANKKETDWYLFGYGLDYHAALGSLTAISGPVPIPRKNLLGIWYSRYWPYTATEFRQIVQEYGEHGFPLDNIVMDMDWHITHFPGVEQEAWTGYTWNRDLIPDPAALLKWFHQQGLFVTLNDHPAQGVQPPEQAYPAFMQAMGEDPKSGKTLPFDAGSKKYLDTFFATTHVPHEKEGVDFWWLDWQQFPNTISVPDLQNLPWLNRYYFERTSADNRRGVSFSRWGGWGDQTHPIHFSGDAGTDWPMLAFEVPFTSTSGNVGCFFWTHDIGGHVGGRNEESYARWCQFGAMSASLRSHSTRNATMDRRPWTYPKWAEDSMRISFRLRSELFPYIYSSAAQLCQQQSWPLLLPMYLWHPDLEDAYHNAQQYYFGQNLLVAPIAMPGFGPTRIAWQRVWFPPGNDVWFNYFTGESYKSGTHTVVASDINQFPLFVRGGVPIPMQPYTPRPATAPLTHLVIRCYPGRAGATGISTLYEDDGQTQDYAGAGADTVVGTTLTDPPPREYTFAQTTLSCGRDNEAIDVNIQPVNGHYAGQPQSRSYTIEIPCVEKPTNVMIDRAPAPPAIYDAATCTARVEVPERSINKGVLVVLLTKPIAPEVMRERAIAARLTGVTGRAIKPANIKQMLSDAMAGSDPSLTTALLASAGVEIYAENDAPYLFGGRDTYHLHADPGVLDSDDAALSLASAQVPDHITPNISAKISDGGAIDSSRLRKLLPPEDSVKVPGKYPSLRLTVNIAGQPSTISFPMQISASASLDLAREAKATATSSVTDSPPSGAIDGIVDGYPNNNHREWSSDQEKEGAAITLTWDAPRTFSEVALYDRPNEYDQVLAGRLVFSDGSVVPFGELANDGATPTILRFAPKTVRSMRVEITKVSPSTKYAGLAEVAVFK
jgi:alpha-glucosidase (family GH31 glycosyl hydrolase)